MRIVVTGTQGQVARSLLECGRSNGIEIVTLGRPQLDLAGPGDSIVCAIAVARPDAIVSAAAYTQVDKAESERELAFAINQRGARAVARSAHEIGVPLIHLSTDYVFDGAKSGPYLEVDPTNPASVYGASKLAGEEAVLAEHPNSAVLRTAWVYSPFGSNFVRTMLRLASERQEIGVVADQLGNPTSALDMAQGILTIAANLQARDDSELRGLFHMTAAGEASWATFAEAVFAASSEAGGPAAAVRPIATADYPTPARRPANSCLDSNKLARVHGVRLPDWRSSVGSVVRQLLPAAHQEH